MPSLQIRDLPDDVYEALSVANRREHPVFDLVFAVLARCNGCSLLTTDAGSARSPG